MWRCWIADTRTGQLVAPLDIPSFSWSVSVGDSSLSTMRDKGVGEDEASGLTLPWGAVPGNSARERSDMLCPDRRMIVLCWDAGDSYGSVGTPIVMGVIGDRRDTVEDTDFSLSSPLQMLSDRYLFREGTFPKGEYAMSGLSYRGLACEVGWHLTLGKPGGGLPIDWQYRGEKGGQNRTFQSFDVQNTNGRTILESLANSGPDMQFRPYISNNRARWRFLAGSDADLTLGQDTVHRLAWFRGGGTLDGLTVDRVGPAQRVLATGSGLDKAQLGVMVEDMRLVNNSRDPWPLRELTYSDTDVNDRNVLKAHADAVLKANSRPLVQFKGVIHASDVDGNGVPLHPFGSMWPGETVEIAVDGYPSLPDGVYECRLMRMDGDETDAATLTFDVMADPAV